MHKLLAILALALVFTSCVKDDDSVEAEPKVILSFDPMVNGQEIQIGERFLNPQGYSVEALQLKFYISNIQLITSGDPVLLSEIAFFDIRENQRTLELEIPQGDYLGIQFDLGVPVNLNGTDNPDFSTSIYDANHPLSVNNGMYWGWNPGYRFFSFEGKCDTLQSAEEFLPMTFAFHTGRDTLFRNVPQFSRNVSIGASDIEHFQFGIELDNYFATEADTVDLKVDRSFHGSPDQIELGTKLANNSSATFTLIN